MGCFLIKWEAKALDREWEGRLVKVYGKKRKSLLVVLTVEGIDIPWTQKRINGRLNIHLRSGVMKLMKPVITLFFLIPRFSV